ncbi:MAG: MFS transporter [Proteobacteria bacterium]|nr:MFS transporter [Pseudomonadota bacterium]
MKAWNKSVLISLLCTLFHYYAFAVYAFSAVILSPIFFHTENFQLTRILGLATFAITLLLKPVGSIIFGHIGDTYGRKLSLSCTLGAITLATTCIGVIPPYDYIGSASGVLLIFCLVIQGLCMGGQYTSAIVFVQEHTSEKHAAFACGLIGSVGVLGTLFGTSISFLFYHRGSLGWEWRVPFLGSAIMGLSLVYAMRYIQETPIFIEGKNISRHQTLPFQDIVKNYKKALCAAIFISSIPVSMFYLATVYLPNFFESDNWISNPLALSCLAQILCMFLIPFLGYFADKFGKEALLKTTSFLLILTPVFMFYATKTLNSEALVIIGIIFFCILSSLYAGPAPAYLSQKFPAIGRCSGMGLGISLGEGVIGGLSPLVCIILEQVFHSKAVTGYYVMVLGVLSFLAILFSNKITSVPSKTDMTEQEICT